MTWFHYGIALAAIFPATVQAETLSGKITDALTHQPVTGAHISFFGSNFSDPKRMASANSDGSGVYSLPDVTSPSGLVMMMLFGYGPVSRFIQLKPTGPFVQDFELAPESVVSGKLTDLETGKPLPKMTLTFRGKSVRFNGSPTDAAGNFKQRSLAPGKYTLEVLPPAREYDPNARFDKQGYAPAFYPGVPRADMAIPITLSPGENRTVDWRLEKRDLYSISGKIKADSEVEMYAWCGDHLLVHGFIAEPGPFRIGGLPPGSYRLVFRTTEEDVVNRWFAKKEFELADRDLEDLRVELQPGAVVSARAEVPEASPPDGLGLVMAPVSTDPSIASVGSRQDKLTLRAVQPGKYWPQLTGLPKGYAVTSVMIGGQEVELNAPLEIAGQENLRIAFRLTTKPGVAAGYLKDPDGKPVVARVILAPARLPLNADPKARRTTTTDANGAFSFIDLPPGRYRAVALGETDEGDEKLDGAEVFELREGEVKPVTLKP